MVDGDVSCLVTAAVSDGHYAGRVTPRLVFSLVALYGVVLFTCWEESRFGATAVTLPGQVLEVRPGLKQSRHLRYQYLEPVTGELRSNTVNIGRREPPVGPTLEIQVLTGDILASRPVLLARPELVRVVIAMHGVLIVGGVWTLVGWIREANSRPLTRQQRAVARLRSSGPR